MKNIVQLSKMLIFDLDGTLYEDTAHFDYYADLLMKELPQNKQTTFWNEYLAMKNGLHTVSIGKGYDLKRDTLLSVDPMNLHVTEVQDWDCNSWSTKDVIHTYGSGPVQFDFENILAIGDGWWLPFVNAYHYGIKDTYENYVKTKEYMVSPDFQLTKTPGLKEALERMKDDKHLVLMSNSEKEDVARLLNELELNGLFDHEIPSAYKPVKTTDQFQRLMNQFNVKPEEMISIGDNFINEISPALKLGMQAVYIHPNGHGHIHKNLAVVPSLANAF